MDDFLIDRETLGKFVDELMKQKPMDVKTPEELNVLREEKMRELDARIGEAIFGALSSEQLAEINALMDNGDESPEVYREFFEKNNVDVDKIMNETFRAFGEEFLGGENE